MRLKFIPHRYFWVVLLALLVACGTLPPGPTVTPTSTPFTQTPTVFSTVTQLVPLPTPYPKFPLSGYVMLFTKDGNLYFQDGENTPVKLAHNREKSSSLKLSDDNQKIVFSRSDGNTYSLNTDGTQEKIVIPNNWLNSLKPGTKLGNVSFIPNTHQLLVETVLCESQEFRSPCSTSIFLADADTGEIKKLADLGLTQQQNSISRNIVVSPDGKMMAVGTLDGMDILTIDGESIRDNVLPYKPSTTTILFPSLFWLPNSSGLIIALPSTIYSSIAYGDLPAHTIWRYMINNNTTEQISLTPPPIMLTGNADSFQVSPDGNWVLYGGNAEYEPSLYVGNLTDGSTQIFGNTVFPHYSWSPDSKHFLFGTSLGTVDGPPIILGLVQPLGWIDAIHFTYIDKQPNYPVIVARIEGEKIQSYSLGISLEDFVAIASK